jgi:hypothetical protein
MLKELLKKYAEYVATTLKSVEPLLKPYGLKLDVQVLYRVPTDCENCLEHVIVIRATCPENPGICKKLIEAFREEMQRVQ